MNEDPQKTWADYYERKKDQRLSEASLMWKELHKAGVSSETVLALDFLHFGNSKEGVESLARQLSENYEIKIVADDEPGYWFIQGTTRPYGITLDGEKHSNWVGFMADVAQSHSCVFSSWALEAPSLGVKFNSEDIESDS